VRRIASALGGGYGPTLWKNLFGPARHPGMTMHGSLDHPAFHW